MALFSRSREAFSAAVRRFMDSVRWSTGRVILFELPTDIGAPVLELRVEAMSCGTLETRLLIESEQSPIVNATLEAEITAIPTLDTPTIVNEKPPYQIEATVVNEEFDSLAPALCDYHEPIPESVLHDIDTSAAFAAVVRSLGWKKLEAAIRSQVMSRPVAMIREGLGVIALVPIIRTAMNLFKMAPALRLSYWKELLAQTQRRAKDLELLGIFPNVPVHGVEKASIDSVRGVIRLWLGLDARGSKGGTLLVARDRETGAIFRVFDRRSVPGGL